MRNRRQDQHRISKRNDDKSNNRNSKTLDHKWLVNEDVFMLSQKKRYSLSRIKENRNNEFDLLVAISWLLDNHDEQYDDESLTSFSREMLCDPVEIIQSYEPDELLDIQSQITSFRKTPASTDETQFWKSCEILCDLRTHELNDGHVSNVSEDIDNILKDKTVKELEELENSIQTTDTASLDSEFWQKLLVELNNRKAILQLKTLFTKALALASKMKQTKQTTTNIQVKSDSEHPLTVEKPSVMENNLLVVPEIQIPNMRQGLTPEYKAVAKMGFEWNRYNQAHYDQDNLPPTTEQGYTFEIHYEDLEGHTKIPTYKIVRENNNSDNQETCIILFRAPEKYRDLAFRIVDKPWDRSSRFAGFTNKFEHGILHLHFKFKKQRYRR